MLLPGRLEDMQDLRRGVEAFEPFGKWYSCAYLYQTGTEGMDCSRAQSAALCNGEVLFTYEGREAVLIIDFDEEKKQVLSTEFVTINSTDI